MLDEIDRGLIHALQIDGRAPFSRIATVLGVSTQTVARRYRRLRAEWGLRVVGLPDPYRAGQARWLVRLSAAPHISQDLALALARRPDTSWVKLASGGTEIITIVDTPAGTPDGPSLLLDDIPRTSGITALSAHYMLHLYLGGPTAWHGRTKSLDPDQQRLLTSPDTERTEPPDHAEPTSRTAMETGHSAPGGEGASDAAARTGRPGDGVPVRGGRARGGDGDAGLLGVLARDGRAGLAELAAATGWSAATVARRLSDLRGSGAIFYDVEINPAALGVTTAALLWMAVAPARLDQVGAALAERDELAFVAATTGRTNLVAHALCDGPAALHRFLTRDLAGLDAIRTLETAPVLRTVKAAGSAVPVRSRRGV